MSARIDLTGQVLDSWTVLRYHGYNEKRHQSLWLCQCECGALATVASYSIRSGDSKNCKRCSGKKFKPAHIIDPVFEHVKRDATKRGLPFEISKQYAYGVLQKQKERCALTGIPLHISEHFTNRRSSTASLDRIDSSKGYVPGNIQWLHKEINQLKWKFPQTKFIELCKIVAEYNQ
jgi:hypothetical protein